MSVATSSVNVTRAAIELENIEQFSSFLDQTCTWTEVHLSAYLDYRQSDDRVWVFLRIGHVIVQNTDCKINQSLGMHITVGTWLLDSRFETKWNRQLERARKILRRVRYLTLYVKVKPEACRPDHHVFSFHVGSPAGTILESISQSLSGSGYRQVENPPRLMSSQWRGGVNSTVFQLSFNGPGIASYAILHG